MIFNIQIFINYTEQLVMIQSKPKYRIKYKECIQNKNHEGQKLNFVCLNENCFENSLICSMCREDSHKGHITQPLKFYIQNLKKEYEQDKRDYSKQFQQLEESRAIFMIKLRQSVEKVAEQFRKLEQQVIQRFEQLRSQIVENQSKRNKFVQFYQSLTAQGDENPQFLIRNYLPAKHIQSIDNLEPVESLGKKIGAIISQTCHTIFSDSKLQQKPPAVKFQQKLANTVAHVGNLYTQNNHVAGVQTLSVIAADLVKNFQKIKIKIRISKIKKGGFIYIGAIQKQLFKSLGNKAPAVWNGANMTGKIFYYNNTSITFGHTSSTLKTFSENSNIEITMNGNVMKIAMKKHSAQFTLPQNSQFYFFFNLQGQTQIQMTQVSNK